MDEVIEEASKKYQGLVPLVYDIETMGLDEARPQDMPYAVYLKREADKVIAEKDEKIRRLRKALLLVCAKRADAEAHIEHNLADLLLKGQTCKSVDFHRLERDKWYKRAVSCRAKAEEFK